MKEGDGEAFQFGLVYFKDLCQLKAGGGRGGWVLRGSERDWPDERAGMPAATLRLIVEALGVAGAGHASAGATFKRFQLSSTTRIHGRYSEAMRLCWPCNASFFWVFSVTSSFGGNSTNPDRLSIRK